MDATSVQLTDLMRTFERVMVPVYQRPYSWDEEHCQELWEDIVAIGRSSGGVHFTGSVVWVSDGFSASGTTPALIIDGQQRVTTVSLILIALAEYALDHDADDLPFDWCEILEDYLVRRHRKGEGHYRLALSQGDRDVYYGLIDRLEDSGYSPKLPSASRLVQNLKSLRTWLSKLEDPESVWLGVRRLQVVSITLDQRRDNPQLVFEKINSTGKELATSDLIRNFVLMTQPAAEQDALYRNYWRAIEETLGPDSYDKVFDDFIKDWLTVLRAPKPPVKKRDVYAVFKRYVYEAGFNEVARMAQLLQEAKRFAGYYMAASRGVHEDPELAQRLGRVARLRLSVANPLVMACLDLYDAGAVPRGDLISMFDTIESYLLRRSVCELPSNGLNKFFPQIVARLRAAKDEGDDYRAVLEAELLDQETTTFRFPSDTEFAASLASRNVYEMKDRRALFLLSRIENSYHPKDERDFTRKGYTVEHIMPQNAMAHREWRRALGEDCEEKHERLVHMLGNLTITAYNSELSDATFAEKKARMVGGYENEYLRISADLKDASVWDEEAIRRRGERLAVSAVEVWPRPTWPEGHVRRREVRAGGKNAYYDVELQDLLLSGSLGAGMRLQLKVKKRSGVESYAVVVAGGKIRLDNGEEFSSPSSAAQRARERIGQSVKSCNGWDYWSLPDGRTLSDVRAAYLDRRTGLGAAGQAKAQPGAPGLGGQLPAQGTGEGRRSRPEQMQLDVAQGDRASDDAGSNTKVLVLRQEGDRHWFYLSTDRVQATAYVRDGRLFVAADSQVDMGASPRSAVSLRRRVRDEEGLAWGEDNIYRLGADVEVRSLNQATHFVAGLDQKSVRWVDDWGKAFADVFPELIG